jgi:hypothetical protein
MSESRGSLSALMVCLVLAAMTLVGLVFDGGAGINEYMRLSDIAENAARVGAQEVDGIRAGEAHIDVRSAGIASQNYLRIQGVTGTVHATRDSVVVEVFGSTKFQILGLVGLSGRRIHVLRSARLVAG